jgi:hypothetical protein
MSWHGNGHGCDATYVALPGTIPIPLSSITSRAAACSKLSDWSTNPARQL